jgi:hypothetical protein
MVGRRVVRAHRLPDHWYPATEHAPGDERLGLTLVTLVIAKASEPATVLVEAFDPIAVVAEAVRGHAAIPSGGNPIRTRDAVATCAPYCGTTSIAPPHAV